MESKHKKFHFQEIDWIVCFPSSGNERKKYLDYDVQVTYRKNILTQTEKQVNLGEVLNDPEIEKNYPHTVGFFKACLKEGVNSGPTYLEIRKIRYIEEFWKFLNDLDL